MKKIKELTSSLSRKEQKEFTSFIKPIFIHEEFQKRMNPNIYPHHDTVSLGEHILSDALITYQKAKNKKAVNWKIAVLIAMFHDLYELPWQNAKLCPERAKKDWQINTDLYILLKLF